MKATLILFCILLFIGCSQENIKNTPKVSAFDYNKLKIEEEITFDSTTLAKGKLPYIGGNGESIDTIKTGEILESGLELIIPKTTLKNGNGEVDIILKGVPNTWGLVRLEYEILNIKCYSNIKVSQYKQGLAKISNFPNGQAKIDGDYSYNFSGFKKGIPIESYNKIVKIPYELGNGETYYPIWTNSKGLNGIVAYTKKGVLANGNGELEVFLKGTPNDTGLVYCDIGFGRYQTQFVIKIKN